MYHVFTRGHDRGLLYRDDGDREHFVELLQTMRERFRVRVYAYCLMPNHYHLLVGTPEGNISRAVQWLNGSYGIWYNRKHRRSGHLFGERFKAVLIENGSWLLEASVYVHLNCVATEEEGLGKQERAAQRQGIARAPTEAEVERRLKGLRSYPWSTYRGYAGYGKMANWIDSGALWQRVRQVGKEATHSYRKEVEDRIRQGVAEGMGAKVRWGLVLGGERFARKVRRHLKVHRESRGREDLSRWMRFDEIVKVVERIRKEKWAEFRDRHGDNGRDLILWAGRRFGGMTLKELGDCAGRMDYSAVAVAILRLVARSKRDRALRRLMAKVAAKCQM